MTIIRLTRKHHPFVYITWGPGMSFTPRPNGSVIFAFGFEVEMEVEETCEQIMFQLFNTKGEKEE